MEYIKKIIVLLLKKSFLPWNMIKNELPSVSKSRELKYYMKRREWGEAKKGHIHFCASFSGKIRLERISGKLKLKHPYVTLCASIFCQSLAGSSHIPCESSKVHLLQPGCITNVRGRLASLSPDIQTCSVASEMWGSGKEGDLGHGLIQKLLLPRFFRSCFPCSPTGNSFYDLSPKNSFQLKSEGLFSSPVSNYEMSLVHINPGPGEKAHSVQSV